MDPIKPGIKSSELIATVAGVLVGVIPAVMDVLPPEHKIYALLGVLLSIATFVAGRSHVKASHSKAQAFVEAVGSAEAAKVLAANPPKASS